MKTTWLSLGLMLAYFWASGQAINQKLGDVVMPPPEAAALGKYEDIPVGYHTGVPSISVPIHKMEEGPLSLNVSASYHASGVKVGEMASQIGLGWVLNASGMVSRTIVGLPDETPAIGYLNVGPTLNVYNECEAINVRNGSLDGEPDMFTFNFNGYSGKFILTSPTEVFMIPKQDIKIEPQFTSNSSASDHLKGFIFTMPDGTKYFFGEHPVTAYRALDFQWNNSTSLQLVGWHLARIQTHHNKYAIDFEYEKDSYSYAYAKSNIAVKKEIREVFSAFGAAIGQFTQVMTFYGERLKTIRTTMEEMSFHYVDNRLDLDKATSQFGFPDDDPTCLNEIRIESTTDHLTARTICRKFEFKYSYFEDASSHRVTANTSGNFRLKLNSIQELTCDESLDIPAYTFSYHNNESLPNVSSPNGNQYLPNRFSKAIDHWGFYNGQHDNNQHPYNVPPTVVYYRIGDISLNQGLTYIGGQSDRESRADYMKLGVLEQITYPTGGHTSFEYEANDYYDTKDVDTRILEFTQSCGPIAVPCDNNYSYIVNTFESSSFTGYDPATIYFNLDFTYCCSGDSSTSFVLNLKENGTIISTKSAPFSTSGKLSTLFGISTMTIGSNYTIELVKSPLDVAHDISFKLTLAQREAKTQNFLVGGLRIKEIKAHDNESSDNDIVRTFEYTDYQSFPISPSSGVLNNLPVYGQELLWHDYGGSANGSPAGCIRNPNAPFVTKGMGVLIQEYSVVPLSSFEGYHVSYGRVIERVNSGAGKTEHYFFTEAPSSPSPILGTGDVHPFLPLPKSVINNYPRPPQAARTQAGKSKKRIVYDESGGVVSSLEDIPLQEDYEFFGVDNSVSPPVYRTIKTIVLPNGQNTMSTYAIRTRPYRIQKTIEVKDGLSVSTVNSFDLNSPHLFPEDQTVINSDGTVHLTKYDYTFENYPDPQLKTELENQFVLTPPWSVEKYVGGILTQKSENSFENTQGFLLPASFTDYPTGSAKFVSEDYTFDAEGRIIQRSPTNDNPLVYIWGHKNMRVMATIANADPEEVAFTSFEEKGDPNATQSPVVVDGGWEIVRTTAGNNGWVDADPTQVQTGQRGFHIQPSQRIMRKQNLPAGTYIVSFWYKGGILDITTSNGATYATHRASDPDPTEMTYYEATIAIGANGTIQIEPNASDNSAWQTFINEVRLYPHDAQMATYCFDDDYRLITETDVNNRSTFYTYDALGRLEHILDLNKHYVRGYNYEYQN